MTDLQSGLDTSLDVPVRLLGENPSTDGAAERIGPAPAGGTFVAVTL